MCDRSGNPNLTPTRKQSCYLINSDNTNLVINDKEFVALKVITKRYESTGGRYVFGKQRWKTFFTYTIFYAVYCYIVTGCVYRKLLRQISDIIPKKWLFYFWFENRSDDKGKRKTTQSQLYCVYFKIQCHVGESEPATNS